MSDEFWIHVHFPDGRPDGQRVATRDLTVGRVLGFSRQMFEETRKNKVWNQPAVYVLRGPGTGDKRQRIYVGKANVLGTRLDQYLADPDKSFWSETAAIVSSAPDQYAVPLDYIEATLIQAGAAAERATMKQNDRKIPHLPPMDRTTANRFLQDALLCLSAIGFAEFEAGPEYSASMQSPRKQRKPSPSATHRLEAPSLGIVAWANWSGAKTDPIRVLRDSQVAPTERGAYRGERLKRRHELRKTGVIGPDWTFTEDTEFETDQEAKQIVLGSNGQKMQGWTSIQDATQ